jgi:hypothetical protein
VVAKKSAEIVVMTEGEEVPVIAVVVEETVVGNK